MCSLVKHKIILFSLFLIEFIFILLQIWDRLNIYTISLILLITGILIWIKIISNNRCSLFENIIFGFVTILSIKVAIDSIRANIDQNNKNNYNKLTLENLNKLDNFTIESNSNKYNIFFIETNPDRILFTTKQLCAIESAAKNNPNGNVYVLSIKAIQNEQFINLKSFYSNIKFMKFVPNEIFKGFINNNISII